MNLCENNSTICSYKVKFLVIAYNCLGIQAKIIVSIS